MIVHHPDQILLKATQRVENFNSEELSALADKMFQEMYDHNGQGLAANQIGVDLSVAVIAVAGYRPMILVNPVIGRLKGEIITKEGCLSAPGQHRLVPRFDTVSLSYQDVTGKSFSLKAKDMLAICIQHECDHLSGLTIIETGTKVEAPVNISNLKDELRQKIEFSRRRE